MLITKSKVSVVDNTGVKEVYLILDSGVSGSEGDVVPAVICQMRQVSPHFKVGSVISILIVGTRYGFR